MSAPYVSASAKPLTAVSPKPTETMSLAPELAEPSPPATPATPTPLLLSAAMVPPQWLPCQLPLTRSVPVSSAWL